MDAVNQIVTVPVMHRLESKVWQGGVVFLVACLAFANTLFNELVYDDLLLISDQVAIRSPLNLSPIWLGTFWGDIWPYNIIYRPVTLWTLSLNYGLNELLGWSGSHTTLYHLANILLHATASVFVLRVGVSLRLSVTTGLAAALLFAVHPIHTEAVAMITGRSEILATGFGLAFTILHRKDRTALAGLFFAIALCSKESAIAFLPLVTALHYLDGQSPSRLPIRALGVYAAVTLGWYVIRSIAIAGIVTPPETLPLAEATTLTRLLTAAHIQVKYLTLQVLPFGLSSDYSYNQIPFVTTFFDLGFLAFCVVVPSSVWLAWKFRHAQPVLLLSVVGYVVLFAPASNFLLPIGTIMGERLAYAPSMFICMVLGLGASRMIDYLKQPGMVVYGILLVACGALAMGRNATWADLDIFATTQVQNAPNSAKANYGAGRARHRSGDLDAAAALYEKALKIKPDYADAWNNLGVLRRDQGNPDLAAQLYLKAISIKQGHAKAHFNLGQVRQDQGEVEEAVSLYRRAIELRMVYPEACNNLAILLAQRGEIEEAVALWEKALRLRPDYAIARTNLRRLGDAIRTK
jgi:protein O-mannosyl-transferase